MSLFFDLYQQYRIAEASNEAGRASNQASRTGLELEEPKRRVDSLEGVALTCQALWEVLRDELGIPESRMIAKMEEIDLRDGRADGRISGQVRDCPQCGRRFSTRRKDCLYCGEPLPKTGGPP